MSSSKGLQSCLEPLLMEPRVLRLKLSPPVSNNLSSNDSLTDSDAYEKPLTNTATSKNDEHDMKRDEDSEADGCSWSIIQSLSAICNKTENPEAESVYVHPTVKSSSLMLSAKSLKMCTESLGCETGSNASDSSDDMSLFSSESNSCFTGETEVVVNRISVPKRVNRAGNSFPPPLTSLTDLGGFQVRPHREDGRLILEAVTSSSPQPYFQAERSNGRLRLRLFESVASYYGDEVDDDDADEEEEEEEEEKEEAEEGERQKEEPCGEEDTGAEEELEEYTENGEDEMEMTKFARPSRCKESGNRDIFGDGYFELPSLSLCL